jgi:hypothetical protein
MLIIHKLQRCFFGIIILLFSACSDDFDGDIDCNQNPDFSTYHIKGWTITPSTNNKIIYLNDSISQVDYPGAMDVFNEHLIALGEDSVDLDNHHLYYFVHYYDHQSGYDNILDYKACYDSANEKVTFRATLEYPVGGSGMLDGFRNFFIMVPQSYTLSDINAIIQANECEDNFFSKDCSLETKNYGL